jgi:hypothetical protein
MSSLQNLQQLCELGQEQLMRTEYLRAESTLEQAEAIATKLEDFDTLSRLYMPLQEARRQRRQRCGEGVVVLDLVSSGPDDQIDGRHVVQNFPHGQLLVAGWGSIEPALKVRQLQAEHELYLETFLAATYPIGDGRAVVIVPLPDVKMPAPQPRNTIDELLRLLPPQCVVLNESELPQGSLKGSPQTFAEVMAQWERLHAPFLAAADTAIDPMQKIAGYRKTIRVDYACELAHQNLSNAAKQVVRSRRSGAASVSIPRADANSRT